MPIYSDIPCAIRLTTFTVDKVAKTDATPKVSVCLGSTVKYITGLSGTGVSPIVITCAGHGLTTGDKIAVEDVVGNKGANGLWTVTVLTSSTFSLNDSAATGDWIDTTADTKKPRFYASVEDLHNLSMTYDPDTKKKWYSATIPHTANLIVGREYFIAIWDAVYGYHISGLQTVQDNEFGGFGF